MCVYRSRAATSYRRCTAGKKGSIVSFIAGNQELARIGKLSSIYGKAYVIEFGIDGISIPENIILLQVRPESVWSRKKRRKMNQKDPMDVSSPLLPG
jgi:hypothetical protein